MAAPSRFIIGIDTHKDTLHVAIITLTGFEEADREFSATAVGYDQILAWIAGHGVIETAGVEGTSSYGAGIARHLAASGVPVVEVNRILAADRRKRGKSDRLDAYRAARSVLAGTATTPPKDSSIEPLRALHQARRSAVKAYQAAWRQIMAILVTAPSRVRDHYRHMDEITLIAALAKTRPASQTDADDASIGYALRCLARRALALAAERDDLQAQLAILTHQANPTLMRVVGVGPNVAATLLIAAGGNPDRLRSEASFAALCGVAPVPASSGKHQQHRLSRGGDRNANLALFHIAMSRMSSDPRTRGFIAGRPHKSKKALIRILKRAIAREIYRALTGRLNLDDYSDLRPARQAKKIPLTQVAKQLNTYPTKVARIELGQQRDDHFVEAYRHWLQAA
jgi:transposase